MFLVKECYKTAIMKLRAQTCGVKLSHVEWLGRKEILF